MVLLSHRSKRVFTQIRFSYQLKKLCTVKRISNCILGWASIEVVIARSDADVRKWLDKAINDAEAIRERNKATRKQSRTVATSIRQLSDADKGSCSSPIMLDDVRRRISCGSISNDKVNDSTDSSGSSSRCSSRRSSSRCSSDGGSSTSARSSSNSSSRDSNSNSYNHEDSSHSDSSNRKYTDVIDHLVVSNRGSKRDAKDDNYLVLGFDVEWRPCSLNIEPETLISLIQLATDKSAILIQMRYFQTVESRLTLTELLNDEKIAKVGVAVLNDLKKVEKDYGACVLINSIL